MKKIILILLFCPLFGFTQTYWQDSLVRTERREAKRDYNYFDSLTATQQTAYIRAMYSLRHKAAHEAYLNGIADSTANAATQAAQRAQFITWLQGKGFLCDNSQADYNKLYNKPKIFGANWQAQATYQRQLSLDNGKGLDHFLSLVLQLMEELL